MEVDSNSINSSKQFKVNIPAHSTVEEGQSFLEFLNKAKAVNKQDLADRITSSIGRLGSQGSDEPSSALSFTIL